MEILCPMMRYSATWRKGLSTLFIFTETVTVLDPDNGMLSIVQGILYIYTVYRLLTWARDQ